LTESFRAFARVESGLLCRPVGFVASGLVCRLKLTKRQGNMAGVVLAGVSRVYLGGVVAVKDLNLEVHDQEFLVLLGPSGCGKTTTLRLIAGLEQASAGTIRIGDRVVNGDAPQRRNIALVFQSCALYPHLTVRGNLAFGLDLRYGGWFRRIWRDFVTSAAAADVENPTAQVTKWGSIDARVRRAAANVGIEGLLERKPAELSGGERQRVALGRAIVREPAVFLFDEPLSNLDTQLRVEMRHELKRLHTRLGTTMVYVTHDQIEALALADRVAVMECGRIRQVGPGQEVYDRPAESFVARFVGSPPMNLIEGEWVDIIQGGLEQTYGKRFVGKGWNLVIDERCMDGLGVKESSAVNRRVTLGIRSEDIYVYESGNGISAGTADVVAIESLGESAIIHLRPLEQERGPRGQSSCGGGGQVLWAKSPTRTGSRQGDRVQVWFDARRIHWFDARTGMNLRRGGA